MNRQAGNDSKSKKVSPWLISIFVFFFVLFVVQGYIVRKAFIGADQLIVENPYEEGIKYQSTINARELALSLGWEVDLHFSDANKEGKRTIRLMFFDEGKLVPNLQVSLRAKMSSQALLDFETSLTEKVPSSGLYEGEALIPGRSLWLLSLEVVRDGELIVFERKEMI